MVKLFVNKLQPIQYINKIPYVLHGLIPISLVKDANDVKAYLGCDVAFKNTKDGFYYFCETIPDTEFEEVIEESVPEITETDV